MALTQNDTARLVLGNAGAAATEFFLILGQGGCLVVYMIYISAVLTKFLPLGHASGGWAWCLILLPVTFTMCQWQDVKMLMQASYLGGLLVVLVVVAVSGLCLDRLSTEGIADGVEAGLNLSTFPEYFGIIFFSMEGIQLLLPVVRRMEHPESAHSVCIYTLAGVMAVYLLLGLIGYLAFGQDVKSPLTDSLSRGGFTDFLQSLMAFILLCTFPLQAFPLSEVFDLHFPSHKQWSRAGMVIIVTAIAMAFPHMGDVIGAVGGLATTGFGAIIPYAMYIVSFREQLPKSRIYGLVGGIITVAVLGVWATAVSLQALYQKEPG